MVVYTSRVGDSRLKKSNANTFVRARVYGLYCLVCRDQPRDCPRGYAPRRVPSVDPSTVGRISPYVTCLPQVLLHCFPYTQPIPTADINILVFQRQRNRHIEERRHQLRIIKESPRPCSLYSSSSVREQYLKIAPHFTLTYLYMYLHKFHLVHLGSGGG